ncbi:MAG: hypothetical protein OK474_07655 [Thaumarchaeota archaeon]|nr:hypothetical protein [Nitrososphaerota archaeon]
MKRKGISSVYGFIMIFLLSMASIQTWSSAVGSMENIQGASDQSHQIQQLQGIEHLSLAYSDENLTIVNDGQVPATVEFLRLVGPNSSSTIALGAPIAVGASLNRSIPSGDSIEAVTSLGNVFVLSASSDPPGSAWSGPTGTAGSQSAQLFENAYDPSIIYLSSGMEVHAFSLSGHTLWSFDAGAGVVTDVMPISAGDVYVSVGYVGTSGAAVLYELDSGGHLIATYTGQTSSPSGLFSPTESMGDDSGYALYGGRFYSPEGPVGSASSDTLLLAATDSSHFYLYSTRGQVYQDGTCEGGGNEMNVWSYALGPGSAGRASTNWEAYIYLGACNIYPQQLIGASTGGDVVTLLFADPAFTDPVGGSYRGENPFLVVLSTTGQTVYERVMPSNGYSAVATDGSNVYLALPGSNELQVVSISTQTIATYDLGFPASGLIWRYGHLFAISGDEVKVYDSSMRLNRTIEFSPLTLTSFSNSFALAAIMQAPSFLVINGTSYAALTEDSEGYSHLVVANYS